MALAITLILGWAFCTWWILGGISDNIQNYKLYKKIYSRLWAQEFHQFRSVIWVKDKDYPFTYFIPDGSICVVEGVYLHSGFLFSLDPIYVYWRYKYRKFFKDWMEYQLILQSLKT